MIASAFIAGNKDISDAFSIREEVFIGEQNCPRQEEFDEFDEQAIHLIIYVDEKPAATGRIWHDGKSFRIGRIAVRSNYRRQKLGDLALRLLLYKAFSLGADIININAQTYIMPFYKKFGFKAHGEEFIEAGILRYAMTVTKDEVLYPSDCCK